MEKVEKLCPNAANRELGPLLLAWYDLHRRELPWRGTRDPYAVWVSEVMLQQTQVATVLRYFPRFLQRFPSISALARAREADVLHAWQGLGYYSRARRLHQGAKSVVLHHRGSVPREHSALLALPGIGAYSAGAILSIAFGERQPLVDGNVVRVLARRFGLRGDPGKLPLRRALWQLAGELVPAERPGDFNQALMELGATVCTPRASKCEACPLRAQCVARREGLVDVLPELPARAQATRVRVAAVVVRDGDRVVVVRSGVRAPRWAGLWTFPQLELGESETYSEAARRAAREQLGLEVDVGARIATLAHTITRFRIALELFEATADARALKKLSRSAKVKSLRPEALDALAMPAPHRKLARLLANEDEAETARARAR